jgi:organic hydroperoxide reductase OsmC/OhrA
VVPKKRFKTYQYQTDLAWTKDRTGILSAAGKPDLYVAAPPEFKGKPGVWTPEDFFVASVSVCFMTTFMTFASRAQLSVKGYRESAEGDLEFVNDHYQFTQIVLKPEVLVESHDEVALAEQTIQQAHEHCLIANSMKTKVEVRATIKVLAQTK